MTGSCGPVRLAAGESRAPPAGPVTSECRRFQLAIDQASPDCLGPSSSPRTRLTYETFPSRLTGVGRAAHLNQSQAGIDWTRKIARGILWSGVQSLDSRRLWGLAAALFRPSHSASSCTTFQPTFRPVRLCPDARVPLPNFFRPLGNHKSNPFRLRRDWPRSLGRARPVLAEEEVFGIPISSREH